jgi:hypothetical protein
MIDRAREEPEATEAPPAPQRRARRSTLLVGVILGIGLTLLGVLVVYVALYRDPLPLLTAESLAAAEERWQAQGPASYQLSVDILGRQPGHVELTVEKGEPVAMTRDNRTPKERHTWAAWTVPSQFDMLHLELEHAASPQEGYGAPEGSQAIVKVDFDPRLGYPVRVRRQVLGGSSLDLEWHVTDFKSLEAK